MRTENLQGPSNNFEHYLQHATAQTPSHKRQRQISGVILGWTSVPSREVGAGGGVILLPSSCHEKPDRKPTVLSPISHFRRSSLYLGRFPSTTWRHPKISKDSTKTLLYEFRSDRAFRNVMKSGSVSKIVEILRKVPNKVIIT